MLMRARVTRSRLLSSIGKRPVSRRGASSSKPGRARSSSSLGPAPSLRIGGDRTELANPFLHLVIRSPLAPGGVDEISPWARTLWRCPPEPPERRRWGLLAPGKIGVTSSAISPEIRGTAPRTRVLHAKVLGNGKKPVVSYRGATSSLPGPLRGGLPSRFEDTPGHCRRHPTRQEWSHRPPPECEGSPIRRPP